MALLIHTASQAGYQFSLNDEKLSSRIHPINEGTRILSRGQPLHSRQPLIFIGFFPIYHIARYLQTHYSKNPATTTATPPPANTNIQTLLSDPPANLPPLAILENRELSSSDIKKLLSHAGIKHPEWQKQLLSSWLKTPTDIETFLTSLKTLPPIHNNPPDSKPPPLTTLSHLQVLISPYALKKDIQTFTPLFHTFKERTLKTHHTESYFSPIWLLNTLQNLSHPQSDIFFIDSHSLPTAAPASPNRSPQAALSSQHLPTAVIVMSGLSSEYYIPSLQSHAKYFPVFSALGLMPWLTAHHVPVAAMIGTDPGFYNRLHLNWEVNPEYPHPPPLFAPLTIATSLARKYETLSQVFYYIDDPHLWEACQAIFLKNSTNNTPAQPRIQPFVPMDASLALSAIRLLVTLGYRRILTYGIDFQTTPFKAHVSGYALEEQCFTRHKRLMPYETLTQSFFHNLKPLPHNDGTANKTLTRYTNTKLELYHHAYIQLLTALRENPHTATIEIARGETIAPESMLSSTSSPTHSQRPSLAMFPLPYSRKNLKTLAYQYFIKHKNYKNLFLPPSKPTPYPSVSLESNRYLWLANRLNQIKPAF